MVRQTEAEKRAFGENFNKLLKDLNKENCTQEQLGEFFDLSQPTISHYKKGTKMPHIETGVKIAKKIGICVEYLYTRRGPMYPSKKLNTQEQLLVAVFSQLSPAGKRTIHRVAGSLLEDEQSEGGKRSG